MFASQAECVIDEARASHQESEKILDKENSGKADEICKKFEHLGLCKAVTSQIRIFKILPPLV